MRRGDSGSAVTLISPYPLLGACCAGSAPDGDSGAVPQVPVAEAMASVTGQRVSAALIFCSFLINVVQYEVREPDDGEKGEERAEVRRETRERGRQEKRPGEGESALPGPLDV